MKKILVVDDEPDIIELTQKRLEANNYKVILASDGKWGLKKAQEEKPDLILMDVLMPEMQGGDAVRLLQADEATKHIPILFLSGGMVNLPPGEETRGVDIGGKFFTAVAKPFKLEKLLSEIKKLIGD